MRLLNKPFLDRYKPPTFLQYESRNGSSVEHVSKLVGTMGPYARDEDLCLCEFSKSLYD